MLLGAADILLEDLYTQITDDLTRRVLRQICVSRAPMTPGDLGYALTINPAGAGPDAPPIEIDNDELTAAVRTLTDFTLISTSTDELHTDTTITMLPWIADRLEH